MSENLPTDADRIVDALNVIAAQIEDVGDYVYSLNESLEQLLKAFAILAERDRDGEQKLALRTIPLAD